jgi:phospholipid/cholesterol/gamma-HCH transport system ATP-binding protein
MDQPIIKVHGVKKELGGRAILKGVDLEVYPGETVAILGSSGSGKSTLLRCMVGLMAPDSGSVKLFDTDIYRARRDKLLELRRKIGVAFQGSALFGSMTVGENVELAWKELTDVPAVNRHIIARVKLGMVGLEDSVDLYPSELSGGMQKRASLARALTMDPALVFFDEPSAGLDPVTAADLDQLLIRLKEAFKMTLVVVTHEMESAFMIADRLALLQEGQFIIVDTPEAVRNSDDSRVRSFLDRRPSEPADGGAKFQQFLEELS